MLVQELLAELAQQEELTKAGVTLKNSSPSGLLPRTTKQQLLF